jgi:diacylglycerol kinase
MLQKTTFLKRVSVAFWGLLTAFEEEANFRIQFLIAIAIVILMVLLKLTSIEKSILLLTILVVLGLELINSQIEKFLDLIEPSLHPRVKIIKDFSAGAVLLSACGSIIIGVLIFYPHIKGFFK